MTDLPIPLPMLLTWEWSVHRENVGQEVDQGKAVTIVAAVVVVIQVVVSI